MHTLIYIWLGYALAISTAKENEKIFTNTWLAEIHGGEAVAERLTRNLGFTFHGQASHFENHYVLTREDHPELSESHSEHLTRDLLDFDEVKWAKQQQIVERSVGLTDTDWNKLYEVSQDNSSISFPSDIMRFLCIIGDSGVKNLCSFPTIQLDKSFLDFSPGVTKNVQSKSRKVSAYVLKYNDPNWRIQWYVQDYRTKLMPVMDHNVVPVYDLGFTGTKVKVAVLDDGVQDNHPDLAPNIDKSLSYDVCLDQPGALPDKLGGWKYWTSSHGTNCAGVIAMVANNKLCGVGIAHGAKVAGVKMMCKTKTEYKEAIALSHAYDKFDIYSSSWTPPEQGHYMCQLDHMVVEAYTKGTTLGRGGKGIVYVQSTGNGRCFGNNCASNCYINNPYVIGITSANQLGKPASYSDPCTAIFATAYSGSKGLEGVSTLNADGGCRKDFSGTSAATPIAAGIFALVLDSKPELTYRDVMHLVAMTAEVAPLADNPDSWHKNGRGLWVSNDFGFGLLNALNMVLLAENWETVPEKRICTFKYTLEKPVHFSPGSLPVEISFKTDACHRSRTDAVNFLEQLEVVADVEYPYRGALSLGVISPANTRTLLLQPRPNDVVEIKGLQDWNIMSVHNWGEDPKGEWTMSVIAAPVNDMDSRKGIIHGFTLKFHGTVMEPKHYKKPRVYSAFRLPNGQTSES